MILEKAKEGNCSNKKGHQFRAINSRKEGLLANQILTKWPSMKGIGLWQCHHCSKIIASM